jgi:hypothetical protein
MTADKFIPVYKESDETLSREAKIKIYEIESEIDDKLKYIKLVTRSALWNRASRVVLFEVRPWGEVDNKTVCSCQIPLDRALADPGAIVEQVHFRALFDV